MNPTLRPPGEVVEMAVRRALLEASLRDARTSGPLLVVAGAFVGWLGWQRGAVIAAVVVVLATAAVAVWRTVLASKFSVEQLSLSTVQQFEIHLRANSLLAGAAWAVATVGIYPLLDEHDAAAHLMILAGLAAIGMHVMALVRWSYPLLVIPSIGSMMVVSLFVGSARSLPMAILSIVYAATLLRIGSESRKTAARAIQHGLEVEEANESLRKAKEDAEAGTIAKSQFLATMSHEIRTPMNGVLGSLQLLRRSPLNDEQRRLVRTAAASGETLMSILNDVLDHSKIEAGKLSLKSEPLSLHDLAASVIALFRANAEAKGLALRLRVDSDVPDWVIGDSQRLKQILLNLVSNAIKFTERGAVHLSLSRTTMANGDPAVHFEVHDTGIGIAPEGMRHLFAPFQQMGPDGGSTRRGTGLGLAISQRIVEAMGSRIDVSSQSGAGSVFSITMQFALHHAPPPAVVETAAGALDAGPLAGTVLVVEDDPVNRLIARSMLESLGINVVEAADGLEALAKGRVHSVDMVFMDCHMPNLDGYTATTRWREREARLSLRRTPIVALTANAFDDDVARTRHAGMDDHLSKPYTREQLRQALHAWL